MMRNLKSHQTNEFMSITSWEWIKSSHLIHVYKSVKGSCLGVLGMWGQNITKRWLKMMQSNFPIFLEITSGKWNVLELVPSGACKEERSLYLCYIVEDASSPSHCFPWLNYLSLYLEGERIISPHIVCFRVHCSQYFFCHYYLLIPQKCVIYLFTKSYP